MTSSRPASTPTRDRNPTRTAMRAAGPTAPPVGWCMRVTPPDEASGAWATRPVLIMPPTWGPNGDNQLVWFSLIARPAGGFTLQRQCEGGRSARNWGTHFARNWSPVQPEERAALRVAWGNDLRRVLSTRRSPPLAPEVVAAIEGLLAE